MVDEGGRRRFDARIFVQARMSSNRFPGKVLAPFRGEPMIAGVLRAASGSVAGKAGVTLLTSEDGTDDPLAGYVQSLGYAVFRGPLDDVFGRFRLAAVAFPCAWAVRICADSPLLDPALVDVALAHCGPDADLITNVFPRTFPKGQSVEVMRSDLLFSQKKEDLDEQDREHVTRYFYRNADRFRIVNIRSQTDMSNEPGWTIDTLDDLRRLETAPAFAACPERLR